MKAVGPEEARDTVERGMQVDGAAETELGGDAANVGIEGREGRPHAGNTVFEHVVHRRQGGQQHFDTASPRVGHHAPEVGGDRSNADRRVVARPSLDDQGEKEVVEALEQQQHLRLH